MDAPSRIDDDDDGCGFACGGVLLPVLFVSAEEFGSGMLAGSKRR